jgi:hypothetical protein
MAVLKNKRTISNLEFYSTARKLRREVTELLRRDFGVHNRKNAKRIDPALPDDYYDADIEFNAHSIRLAMRDLMWHIRKANSIYPTTQAEMDTRRYHQDEAIGACQIIYEEFMNCVDTLPMLKASMFVPYSEMIEYEIKLLKGWRKSNKKIFEQTTKAPANNKKEGGEEE